jgi:hypothetical protein
MINDNYYVYKKEVDWSVLHQDVSISVTIQIFFKCYKKVLTKRPVYRYLLSRYVEKILV